MGDTGDNHVAGCIAQNLKRLIVGVAHHIAVALHPRLGYGGACGPGQTRQHRAATGQQKAGPGAAAMVDVGTSVASASFKTGGEMDLVFHGGEQSR
jgi:hypothetical protein